MQISNGGNGDNVQIVTTLMGGGLSRAFAGYIPKELFDKLNDILDEIWESDGKNVKELTKRIREAESYK